MDAKVINVDISDCGLDQFLGMAAKFGTRDFGYVVTPNVDHLIRYCADAPFREIYRYASLVLLDSRFLAGLLKMATGVSLPTCPGSDLTAALFDSVISPDDPLLMIGGTAEQADVLRRQHRLQGLRHFNPPMKFFDDPTAVEDCLDFIEKASPFRFCFLAVGCPQQERLAHLLMARERARGLALCVGGAMNFLTGAERRAPLWMQECGMEWLYRLVNNPSRLAHRYLVRGPRIFFLLPKLKFRLSPVAPESAQMVVDHASRDSSLEACGTSVVEPSITQTLLS